MKTAFQKKALALFALVLAVFALPQAASAQCPTINNNTGCDIEVIHHIFDAGGTLCFSSTQYVIPAGFSFPVPCACLPMGLFVVELRTVGTTSILPIPIISYPGASSNSFTAPRGCGLGTMISSANYVVDIN